MRKLSQLRYWLWLYSVVKLIKLIFPNIIVLDSNFNQIRVVEEADPLNNVCDLWKGFEPIDDISKIQWTHKLDIKSNNIGGRGLYSQEGYIDKLNKELKPRYKVSSKGVLNKLILGF